MTWQPVYRGRERLAGVFVLAVELIYVDAAVGGSETGRGGRWPARIQSAEGICIEMWDCFVRALPGWEASLNGSLNWGQLVKLRSSFCFLWLHITVMIYSRSMKHQTLWTLRSVLHSCRPPAVTPITGAAVQQYQHMKLIQLWQISLKHFTLHNHLI